MTRRTYRKPSFPTSRMYYFILHYIHTRVFILFSIFHFHPMCAHGHDSMGDGGPLTQAAQLGMSQSWVSGPPLPFLRTRPNPMIEREKCTSRRSNLQVYSDPAVCDWGGCSHNFANLAGGPQRPGLSPQYVATRQAGLPQLAGNL